MKTSMELAAVEGVDMGKRHGIHARAVRALTAVAVLLASAPARSGGTVITILHLNDTHGHLDAVGPKDAHLDGTLGGLAKAATVVRTLRAAAPGALLLHAGDVFQGDSYFNATSGVAELQLLARLGVDAMAVGNHELVFGPEFLRDVLGAAFTEGGFPLVSANLDVSPVPGLDRFVQPSILKRVGEVQVGVVGLLTPFDASERPSPAVLHGDGAEAIAEIASAEAARLRGAGASVVVALSHLGVGLDTDVAAHLHGIDAIVGGHSHTALFHPVFVPDGDGKAVPIVQAGEFYEHVGKLTLSVDGGEVALAAYELVPVNAAVERDDEVRAVVRQLQAGIGDDLFHRPIALALHDLTRDVDPSGPARDTGIGDLVADALRHRTGAEIGLTVNGLLEDRVARGLVVADDLFRVTSDGFDPEAADFPGLGFRIFTFEIAGADLAAVLEQSLALGGDFSAQVSGMRFAYDPSRPEGQRLVSVHVHDRQLDPARFYTVAVNFGVKEGLVTLLHANVRNLCDTGDYEFLAVRDWAARLVLLDYRPEGRILELPSRAR